MLSERYSHPMFCVGEDVCVLALPGKGGLLLLLFLVILLRLSGSLAGIKEQADLT